MKRAVSSLIISATAFCANAVNRFPKPDFSSGYEYPTHYYPVPAEPIWGIIDLIVLVALMGVVAYAVIQRSIRRPVLWVTVSSVLYFGFFREGCVCSVGSLQNIAAGVADSSIVVPIGVLLFFVLPILFTLFFGRVFCGGVCPLGAIQELVHIKSFRLSKAISATLGLIPWFYLGFAVLFAITRSGYLICRYDPFVGIFRLGGDTVIIGFGIVLLILSLFIGRPFCRFICPYGAVLSLFSRVSFKKTEITRHGCINCDLCRNACPVDAILPPYENQIKESRAKGVRRVLLYMIVLPLLMGVGAMLLRSVSDTLSLVNKRVQLLELVKTGQADTQSIETVELQAFFGKGGTVEDLQKEVEVVQSQFKMHSTWVGAFFGLVVGLTLLSLSLKRTRKTYTIDSAACISCGRCFSYCPQNTLDPTGLVLNTELLKQK